MAVVPSEHQEQCAVVQWLEWNNIDFFAVPNANAMSSENRTKAIRIAVKQKKEGVKAGVSDLVILGYKRVLFVEMKRVSGSAIQPEQIEWRDTCLGLGHEAVICKGAAQAVSVIKEWLKGE